MMDDCRIILRLPIMSLVSCLDTLLLRGLEGVGCHGVCLYSEVPILRIHLR